MVLVGIVRFFQWLMVEQLFVILQHVFLLLLILFANRSIKQIAVQQRTERHRSALTSALNKIEIDVK